MKWDSLLVLFVSILCIVSCQTKEKSDLLFEKYYEPESQFVDRLIKKFDLNKNLEIDSFRIREDSMYLYSRKLVKLSELDSLEKYRNEYLLQSLKVFKSKNYSEAYKRFEYYCATYFDNQRDLAIASYYKAKSNLNDGSIDQSVIFDYEDYLDLKRINKDFYDLGNWEMILAMVKMKNPNAKGLLEATFTLNRHIKQKEIKELYDQLD